MGLVSGEPMLVIGHRGASHTLKENTLAAFSEALRVADGFECDLQLVETASASRLRRVALVVLHDSYLWRTCTPSLDAWVRDPLGTWRLLTQKVDQLTLCEVRRGDASVPLFEEALELLANAPPSKLCFAELKPCAADDVSYVCDEAQRLTTPSSSPSSSSSKKKKNSEVVWISFCETLATEMKRRNPARKSLLVARARTPDGAQRAVERAAALGLDGVDLEADARFVTRELVDDCKRRGLLVAVWVEKAPAVNDTEETFRAMQDAGVWAFTSNLPPDLPAWSKAK